MNKPRYQYRGEEMKKCYVCGNHFYSCTNNKCRASSPFRNTAENAYAAAMKRENKYREQVEYDIRAALNALHCISNQIPYHIYSMLYDQISAIGYTPIAARMSEEANDER